MKAIVAISNNDVIGVNDKLPWDCPEDLQFFKEKTLNQSVIVGNKTFKRMPWLFNRQINVVTADAGKAFNDYVDSDPENSEKLFKRLTNSNSKFISNTILLPADGWVIGGSQIYQLLINEITEFYISRIPVTVGYSNDDDVVFFPCGLIDDFVLTDTIDKNTFTVKIYKRK
jgi:dihydrofolate reductase